MLVLATVIRVRFFACQEPVPVQHTPPRPYPSAMPSSRSTDMPHFQSLTLSSFNVVIVDFGIYELICRMVPRVHWVTVSAP